MPAKKAYPADLDPKVKDLLNSPNKYTARLGRTLASLPKAHIKTTLDDIKSTLA